MTAQAMLALMTLAVDLEPEAVDLFKRLLESMKGKSAEEIAALDAKIFSDVETRADAELGGGKQA
jgi:hypothetical protein